MDSIVQITLEDSEIINKTTYKGDAWIRQCKQPLQTQKSSLKTESLPTQKSPTKLLPLVTHGFDRANSPYGLRNQQRNYFHGWRMDSTAQTTLWTQKSSTKPLPPVTHGFDSANNPCGLRNHHRQLSRCRLKNHQPNCFHGWGMDSTSQRALVGSKIINEIWVASDLEIINETASTGDTWIRQRKHPLWTQNSSTKLLPRVTHGFDSANSPCGLRNHQRNCFIGCRMDSTAQTAPADSKIIIENWFTPDSEIINETASTGDAWIRQRKQPLGTRKSSTKLLPQVTHGFDSTNSPCRLRNQHWKLSRCLLKNYQRNCFHGWCVDSTAQTAPVASEIFNETASTGDAWIRQRKQPL